MNQDQTDNFLRLLANIDAANDISQPHGGHRDFRTFEGTALADDASFIGAVHIVPDAGSIRLVLDPADANAIRRTVLDDGRIALEFTPSADEGVTISIAVSCPACASDLVSALDNASDRLDELLDDALCPNPSSVA